MIRPPNFQCGMSTSFFYWKGATKLQLILPNLNPFALAGATPMGLVPLVVSQFTVVDTSNDNLTLSVITTSDAALSLPMNVLIPRGVAASFTFVGNFPTT